MLEFEFVDSYRLFLGKMKITNIGSDEEARWYLTQLCASLSSSKGGAELIKDKYRLEITLPESLRGSKPEIPFMEAYMFSKVALLVIKRVLEVMKMSGSVVKEAGELRDTTFSTSGKDITIKTVDTELINKVKELSLAEKTSLTVYK